MDKYGTEWNDLLNSIGARNMIWGIHGGNEWISYKQNDENDFSVQIFTHDGFDEFKRQKDAIIEFFKSNESILVNEKDVKSVPFGIWKQLEFIDKFKYDALENEKQKLFNAHSQTNIGTQINAPVNTSGAIFNSGEGVQIDNSTSTLPEDQKWFQKELVKMFLSFISGIVATVGAQWIMRLLGWIS